MRQLIEGTLITLNGAVTNQGKWSAGYFDAEAKAESIEALKECDLLLLGRMTYEQFAPRWSQIRDDSYFAAVNTMNKVVLSNSLETATWNAEMLRRMFAFSNNSPARRSLSMVSLRSTVH
jgi:hypothetical protein